MAIDLPPGTPPALASMQEIMSYEQVQTNEPLRTLQTRVAGYDVIVYGNTQLSDTAVTEALERGAILSEAIWHLHYAYMNAGHRLTRLRYVLKNNRLHIHVLQGYIADVQGPDSLTRYFWDVDGKSFDLPGLETGRLLANLQAQREGLEAHASYDPIEPYSQQVRMSLETREIPDHKPVKFEMQFGNPGNRFVGRHFVFANATLDSKSAQWKLSLNKSVNSLDETRHQNGALTSYQLATNTIIPIGLAGLGISSTRYHYTDSFNNQFNAEIQQAQILLQEILHSAHQQRTLISQRLLFVDSERISRNQAEAIVDERYFAADIGIEHSRRQDIWGYSPLLKFSAHLRKGLSDGEGTHNGQDDEFKGDARFLTFKPMAFLEIGESKSWHLDIELVSQYSDRPVPEQEQWHLGGHEKLKAWLPGSLLGDTGHYLGMELFTPDIGTGYGATIKPSLFLEAGHGRFKSASSGLHGTQRAYDAGLALGVSLEPHWELNLSIAEALSESELSEDVMQHNRARFFITLKAAW